MPVQLAWACAAGAVKAAVSAAMAYLPFILLSSPKRRGAPLPDSCYEPSHRGRPVRDGTCGQKRAFAAMASANVNARRGERLKSWKEIAAFFGTDERTVRRWEERGLPV